MSIEFNSDINMPRKPAQKRIKAYIDKKEGMTQQYVKRVSPLESADLEALGKRADWDFKLAGLLTSRGVTGLDRIKYLNFARSLIKRQEDGTLTDAFVEAKKQYYLELYPGIDEGILDEIARIIRGTS